MIKKAAWGKLGRDFWLFRFGQVISIIGDSCGHIAMSWWILEKTGSASKMAAIIAPAMFVRIFLMPLFGPLGDKFSRKMLIFIGDVWRGLLTLVIASMVFFDYFYLPVLITAYILLSIGSALFHAVAGSIVPQLVKQEHLQTAMQQESAIMSGGSIVGGIAGGLLVSFLGIGGAFVIDGFSFMLAGIASIMIRSNTKPVSSKTVNSKNPLVNWFEELKAGFRVVVKIPVEFWVAVLAAFMNLVASPIGIALPVLVKELRNMPPWFLGALQSSVSVGSIIGAMIVGWVCKRMFPDFVIVFGIVMLGLGIGALPLVNHPAFPITMMLFVGIGSMLANIPLNTKTTLAMPDEYRSRARSVMLFLCQIATPIGTMLAGYLITSKGVAFTMVSGGGMLVLLTPLLFLIPGFSKFCRLSPEEASTFYTDNYPDAFKKS